MKKQNKNTMIHLIKEKIGKKKYNFPKNTFVEMDRYDEYLNTELVGMYIKGGVLYLVSNTSQYGVETDKVSEFHTDFVNLFYNYVMKNV